MSDRIAVMRVGKIEQMGEAESLYEHPRTRYVSQFLGSCNLHRRDRDAAQRQTARGANAGGRVARRVWTDASPEAAQREKFTLAIRPEKVTLCPPQECAGENRMKVRVEELIYIGSETHYVLRAGEQRLTAEAMNVKVGSQGFDIGQEAIVHLAGGGLARVWTIESHGEKRKGEVKFGEQLTLRGHVLRSAMTSGPGIFWVTLFLLADHWCGLA